MLAFALASAPQDATASVNDAKCVVVLSRMLGGASEQKNAELEGQATAGMMFFLGKLLGREGAERVKALVEAEDKDLTEAQYAEIGTRCGQEMIEVGNLLS